MPRPTWWAHPARNTLDRATSSLPRLLHRRLDDFGLDVAIIYPSIGLFPIHYDEHHRLLRRHAVPLLIAGMPEDPPPPRQRAQRNSVSLPKLAQRQPAMLPAHQHPAHLPCPH
jgi:hypothetical protein